MTQLLIVAGVALVVVLAAGLARYAPVERTRPVRSETLPPGWYFLSSGGCDTCEAARQKLDRARVDYTELVWQQSSRHFDEMGIDAVPSLVEIGESGFGRWWRGGIPLRLRLKSR